MALLTASEAAQAANASLENKLNEAISQAASKGLRTVEFDLGPWPQSSRNTLKTALQTNGFTVQKVVPGVPTNQWHTISWT